MGTKMVERSPGELHTYNINKEGSKLNRRFQGVEPTSIEAGEIVTGLLNYYLELIHDNPITISSRNAAAIFVRLGRLETVAMMGDWWFKPRQILALTSFGSLLRKQLFRCTNEDVVTALWGMSILGPKMMDVPLRDELNLDSLIHDIVNRILRDISRARSIDLTLFVEALARLQYKNIDFAMHSVTYETKYKITRFNDQDIPRFLWSLAQMGYPSRDGKDNDGLLSTLAWECKKRLAFWNGIELARVVWAFGVLQFSSIQHLLSLICSQRLDRAHLTADAVVKVLWGLDTLHHHPGRIMLTKLGRSFAIDIGNLFPRDITTGFMSLLNFGLVDDRVPTRVKELILRSEIEGWSARDAANMIWILARADFLEQDTFMVLRRYILGADPSVLPRHAQADLYRCYLHMNMFRPTMARLLPENIGQQCQEAWIERQQETAKSSGTELDVLEHLKQMQFTVEEGTAIEDGLLFAHTAAKDADQQFAVEVIHPPKCYINDISAINEQQSWREDLLMGWGWKILRVEEKRWGRINDASEKTELLQMLINRA